MQTYEQYTPETITQPQIEYTFIYKYIHNTTYEHNTHAAYIPCFVIFPVVDYRYYKIISHNDYSAEQTL